MSLPRQTPINGTYQKRVPPGSQTNLYHILLSNLPWQTSWQQLKDHVRGVCPVERVEVFNESTTGWVSVRGRDNFEAAFNLLNGGIFNGRPLFADGKNATAPVMIKEPVEATTQAHRHAPSESKQTRRSSPASSRYQDAAPAVMPPLTPVPDQWFFMSPSCAVAPPTSDFPSHSSMQDTIYGYGSPPGFQPVLDKAGSRHRSTQHAWPVRISDHPTDSYYVPIQQSQPALHSKLNRQLGYEAELPASDHSAVPDLIHQYPAGHRVIIRHIAPHVTYGEFDHLLRHKIGRDVDSIVQLELPISESYDSNSGYAVATFHSEGAAVRAVRKFHGAKFENRLLKAELVIEGVAQNNSQRSMGSRKPARGDKEKTRLTSAHNENNSYNKKTRSSPKSGIIIANGSSSTRSTHQKL
ncbi:uncharacterized protein B0I36DRAFT_69528 [Microdochium trichocladiopsis]|uniref:RRM domain-containing protein n=1 Tax=Microdochium trichocladiopsis TaxID=1682393 RepID=A0A9P8YEY4_9PEZI|nr:uncharacterized protein B0I36DRAFT_69528 [Microdochium trichocladiopsis]KAH7037672.1 hypothetical protein B0I36DRAFT_69528 [Microdochium trichocladiopsis]